VESGIYVIRTTPTGPAEIFACPAHEHATSVPVSAKQNEPYDLKMDSSSSLIVSSTECHMVVLPGENTAAGAVDPVSFYPFLI